MVSFLQGRIVYILIAVSLTSFAIVDYKTSNKRIKTILLLLSLFVFTVFGILRGSNVGLDTAGYSINYYNCREVKDFGGYLSKNKPEFIFYGLMYIFSKVFSLPEITFYIFEYLFISCFLFLAFKKQNNAVAKLCFMFFVGFFIMSYSGIRQTMAMSLMTFGISLFLYGKVKPFAKYLIFFLCLFISVGFHSSALMLIPFPLLLKIKLTKNNFILLAPILFFIPGIAQNLMTFASTLVYVNYNIGTYRVSFTFIFFILVLVVLYLFIGAPRFSEFVSKKINIFDFKYDKEMNDLIINLYFALAFMSCNVFSLVVPRYAMYFYFGIAVFIVRLIESLKKDNIKTITLIASLIVFAAYFVISTSNLGLVPYRFL